MPWRYSQRSGYLQQNDVYVEKGYSGSGIGYNNPALAATILHWQESMIQGRCLLVVTRYCRRSILPKQGLVPCVCLLDRRRDYLDAAVS